MVATEKDMVVVNGVQWALQDLDKETLAELGVARSKLVERSDWYAATRAEIAEARAAEAAEAEGVDPEADDDEE